MKAKHSMKLTAKTDRGLVRATNQDAYVTGELAGGVAVAIVCDGMGGAKGGNIASSISVRLIYDQIASQYREDMQSKSVQNMLESVINAANADIFALSRSNPDLNGMGTTVVVALIADGIAYIAHAGDSRAYSIHNGVLSRLTRDHSVVQQMVELGQLTTEEARNHPQCNIITKAIGVDEYIDPEFSEYAFHEGDCILICTDGLTNAVSDEAIADIAKNTGYVELAARLVDAAKKNGGRDNITVVTIS